jgi:hypothetical protein
VLLGGDDGAAEVKAADSFMKDQRIVDPLRMCDTLAPGFAAPG